MRTELKKNEKKLIIIRQHWLRLVLPFFAWIVLAILLFWWLKFSTALIIVLLAAIYPLIEYVNWKNNIWCVTNMRVVDESGFFSRYSKESPLDKINNVEYDQTLWGRLLGYGSVDIQTAAELGETRYEFIHHPKLLKDTITHAREENKNMQVSSQAAQLAEAIARTNVTAQAPQQMIADELQKLFDLLQKGAITQEEYATQKNKLMGS
ncbi:MAG: PH domain-containing protein [Ferruginibacter sp.]|nr:PH domain-containing protein [Bacteroidota bacterium]MBX2918722.1 PH domain-containing protein [Ferruginibacter sp.]MCB0710265.1 PH domain-containing protein [Chitinophagaceae bacterium]